VTMRNTLFSAMAAAALLLAGAAQAQVFPSKTIRLVSGVTPGSASDTIARIIAPKLQASLGQPVIVENRLGAGGLIGAASVAKGEPDGHTINIYTSAFTIAPLLNPGVLDPKDLAPVAAIATIPTVLVVPAGKGYKSVADLVAAAKSRPGDIVATTAGIGSSTHMNLELFRIAAGIDVLQVPMKGAAEAFTEVLTGRADFYFALPFQVKSYAKDGKILTLATGAPKRSALFPDLPTTVEAGFPKSDYNFWIGALVAAKTPREIVQRLQHEINAAVNQPEVREQILKIGAEPLAMSLPEFEAMIQRELADNAALIKAGSIRLQ
jgi:tripartite-type tricarboxylate transporter receptor subunit TctC